MRGPLCLAAALLFLTGCVTEEPERRIFSKEESEEVAAFNFKLAERFWERDRKDLAFRYLEMAARQEPEAAAPKPPNHRFSLSLRRGIVSRFDGNRGHSRRRGRHA